MDDPLKDPTDSKPPARTSSQPPLDPAQLKAIFEDLEDVVFSVDAGGRLLYLSPSAQRRYGYVIADMIGRSFAEVVHPDDLPGLMASFARALEGRVEPHVFRGFDASGRIRHVRTLSRARIVDGKPTGLTGVMIDITQLEEARADLQSSRSRAWAMFDGIPIPTFLFRRAGRDFVLEEANSAAREITMGGSATGSASSRARCSPPDPTWLA